MKTQLHLKALALLSLVVIAGNASAYQFVPTEAEFLAWPTYCKVVYTRTEIGATTGYDKYLSVADESEGLALLGPETYGGAGGIHHHCTGLVWLWRAQRQASGTQQDFMFQQAITESIYTSSRIETNHPLFAQAYNQVARAFYETGEFTKAVEVLDKALAIRPNDGALYAAKGVMLYRLGKLEESRQALAKGNDAAAGQSAEIHYNLGLVLLKLKQPDVAAIHGKEAYRLGFPLPGLKRKLIRAGVWD